MEKAINQFLKRFRSVPNESEQLENAYIPNEPKKLLISHTVGLENRTGFNETFKAIHNESNKLKFNR